MKKPLLLFMGVFCNMLLFSQSQLQVFQDWETTAGTQNFYYRNVTRTDGSGNVYVAGATLNASNNTTDILVAKFNSAGVQQWISQYNGAANYYDFATAMAVDASGNVYITGTVTNDTLNHYSDIITIKYNSSGAQQWLSTYDGAAGYFDSGTDLFVNASGGVGLVGSSMNAGMNMDFVTIFYNSSGVQQWAAVYDHSSHMNDVPVDIVKRGTSIYVSGVVQTGATAYSWNVVEYNSSGVQQSVATSAGGSSNIDTLNDMVTDAAGNIYIAGATSTATHGYDYDVIKLDSTLAIQWEKTYDGADHLDDVAHGIKVDALGDVYVTGSSKTIAQAGNYLTQKYDSSGNLIWTKSYNDTLNGDDSGNALELSSTGEVYVTGSAYTDSLNTVNYHTMKYDTSGTILWAIDFDGNKHLKDIATNIAIDTVGNVIVAGSSETAAGMFEYATVRYVEKRVVVPTDYYSETSAGNFSYYENKGQLLNTNDSLVPQIRYYTANTYPVYYVQNNNFSFVFSKIDTIGSVTDTLQRIDLTFHQANTNVKVYPMEEQKDYLNYYYSHIPDGLTGIQANKRLVTTNLYSNIDLEYLSNSNGLKYYFIIKPGGNPANIQIEYAGASSYSLNGTTNALTINSYIGSLTFNRPAVYQLNSSNVIIPITGWTADWQTNGAANKYKFNIGAYDNTKPLIIEVDQGNAVISSTAAYKNLTWSTYYEGNNDDKFTDIVTDYLGDIYTAVETKSTNFPVSTGVASNTLGCFLAGYIKFNKAGVRQYASYYGVTLTTQVPIIQVKLDVDSHCNIFLTGGIARTAGVTTDIPFPSTPPAGAYVDHTYGSGVANVFLTKFDSTGTHLLWTTYYGSTAADYPDINVDLSNNAYLTFQGASDSLKHFPGGYWDSITGGGFIVKFNPGLQRTWATAFPRGIIRGAFDKTDNFFVTGGVSGTGMPWTNPGAPADFDTILNGGADIFVGKFSKAGSVLQWLTSFGGSGDENVTSIKLDKSDNIYLTGVTKSTDFPYKYAGSGTYCDSIIGGARDAFFFKFSSNLSRKWGSYFGSSGISDYGYDIATDPITGQVFFTGYTSGSVSFWGSTPYYSQSFGGGSVDGYIAAFTQGTVPVWGTYLGYASDDVGLSVVANNWNQLFLAGYTNSSQTGNFLNINPGAGTWFVNSYSGGGYDAHISRFVIDPANPIGINEHVLPASELLVYPNPSSGQFNYSFNSTEKTVFFKIYNLTGQLMFIQKSESANGNYKGTVDLSSSTNGIYFIVVETATGRTVKRIAKQ